MVRRDVVGLQLLEGVRVRVVSDVVQERRHLEEQAGEVKVVLGLLGIELRGPAQEADGEPLSSLVLEEQGLDADPTKPVPNRFSSKFWSLFDLV